MNGKTRPVLAIMAAASLWGFIGLFSYILMFYGFSPVQVIAVRTIAGALFMTAFLLVRSPALLKINPRDIWMFIGTGIISVVLFNLFYLTTFTLSSLSVAVMLLYTAPVFVMLLSLLLFREQLTFSKILALCSTISGCLFLSGMLTGTWQCPPEAFFTGILSGFGSARRKPFLQVFFPVLAMLYTAFSANMRLLNIIRQPFPSGLFIWRLCLCCRSASRMLC